MDATIRSHIENLFNHLAKMDHLRANADWLQQALFNVPRHLFIEQYYDGEGPDGIVHVESPIPTAEQLSAIYSNRGLMIREDPHSAASQPSLIFSMLNDLKTNPRMQGLRDRDRKWMERWTDGVSRRG